MLLRMAADQERADRIRALKQDRPDLTWRRIADYVGVTERSATDWQKKGGIDYDNAKKLAALFEVDTDYIWRGTPEEERAPSPFAGQDAVMDRLDAIDQRLANLENMVTQGLSQLEEVLSDSAVAQVDRIVRGIVEDVQAGKLPGAPPKSRPKASKPAPKSTRAA